jgi:hypothetical protein
MKPIKPPLIIKYGIVVYVPTRENFTKSKVEIFYSPKNPLFSYAICDDSSSKIWEKKDTSFNKGSLYIYNTSQELKKGFYQIKITMYDIYQTKVIEGSNTYGVLTNKDSLYIGLPYSSFEPIFVS